jgi:hypothetical protein
LRLKSRQTAQAVRNKAKLGTRMHIFYTALNTAKTSREFIKSAFWATIVLAGMTVGIAGRAQNVPAEQVGVVHITAPRQDLRQIANFIDLRYELTTPAIAASSSPNFKIQLDSNATVNTTSTQQSFTGLTAGTHVISVQSVDANGTPIPDSQATVRFTVVPTTTNGGSVSQSRTQATLTSPPQAKTAIAPGVTVGDHEDSLPPASSSLPILSIVGFGVLVGGVISAMKTR